MQPWATLVAHGLPDGPVRPAPQGPPDEGALSDALDALDVAALSTRERELLLAWLAAFAHHWPTRFRSVFEARGAQAVATLRALPHDANRYLKLRRIAIENLSRIL